jgi:hypothetical protein
MAQIFKKSFSNSEELSWLVAIPMVLTLAIVFWQAMPIKEAKAAVGDGVSSDIWLLDTNSNGKIDRLTVNITNPNFATEQMVVNPNTVANCLDVQYGGQDITISGTPTITTGVNPAVLTINLDESDPQLVVDTDGVSSDNKMELIYTGMSFGQCIDDGNDEDLNNIVTGDFDEFGIDNEIDGAKPVISTVTYKDNSGDGKIDGLTIAFSEWVTSNSTIKPRDIQLTSAGDFTTAAIGGNADNLIVATVMSVNLTLGTPSTVFDTKDDSGTFAIGLVGGPAWTLEDNSDMLNSQTTTLGSAITYIDGAAPFLVSALYKDVTLVDGTVDRVDVTFSEAVTLDEYDAADWTFGNNTVLSLADTAASTNSADVRLIVTATANITGDGGTVPTITYTNGATANSLHDAANNNTVTSVATNTTDGAAPYLISATYSDSQTSGTGYGEIDRITLVFTENTNFTFNLADWEFFSIGDVAMGSGFQTADCLGTGTTTIVCTDADNSSLGSGINKTGKQTAAGTEPIWYYTNNANRVTDGTNHMGAISKTLVDGAAPMLASSTPTASYAGYSRTGDIVLTFSEVMEDTGETAVNLTNVTASPTWGTPIVSSDVNDVAWTFDPSVTFASHTSYTITISSSIKDNSAAANAIGTTVLTFTSASGGGSVSGGSSTVTSTTPVVTLTTPVGGVNLTSGDVQNVTWTTSGSGIDTVGIYYSADNGSTYNLVAYNLNKSLGTYEWTLPNIDSETVLVKIIAYDSGKGNLDSDVSTVFSITASSETVAEAETPAEDILATDDEGRTVGTDSGLTGPSPVTGEDEVISTVVAGEFIRGYSFNTIYYIDENNERRPFLDTNSFFTYADSFDEVVWVTDATLPTMTLGAPMLPKVGVVLVKIQSDPKVYAIDTGDVLRWVPTEEVAISLYGSAWADYVIDLESTTFARFSVGDDMTESDLVDLDIMKTRMELAASAW